MAITSFPFDGQDTTENQFSVLFRELQTSGVAGSVTGSDFKVSAATGMSVQVQPGLAILRGHAVESTAVETLAIPNSTGGTITHRLVLRLDTTANSIVLALSSSAPGAAVPALTQSLTGIFEISLAVIAVPANSVNVTDAMIVDYREFVGQTVGAWSTSRRPTSPRVGRTGWNTNLGYLETWNGSVWASSMPIEAPGTIKMWAGAAPPSGWLLCQGQSLLISDYVNLNGLIGNYYGGNGTTHFNLPNFSGRAPIGSGTATGAPGATNHPLGQKGGEEAHTLTVAELASHSHGQDQHTHAVRNNNASANPVAAVVGTDADTATIGGGNQYVPVGFTGNLTIDAAGATIHNAGGSGAHNTMMPYQTVNFIIKF